MTRKHVDKDGAKPTDGSSPGSKSRRDPREHRRTGSGTDADKQGEQRQLQGETGDGKDFGQGDQR